MGPSAMAGKNVRPPMITITPTTRPTKRPPVVGKVQRTDQISPRSARDGLQNRSLGDAAERPTRLAGGHSAMSDQCPDLPPQAVI